MQFIAGKYTAMIISNEQGYSKASSSTASSDHFWINSANLAYPHSRSIPIQGQKHQMLPMSILNFTSCIFEKRPEARPRITEPFD
jgi:hypothetical protein